MAEIYLTTKGGAKIRILTPDEYDRLTQSIPKEYLWRLFQICFYTGMRYIEIQRLYQHPEYWQQEKQVIYLKPEAQMERWIQRTAPARWVQVVPQLQKVIPRFFNNTNPPTLKVWGENLKRWAEKADLTTVGVVPKMTRASIEAWMYVAEIPMDEICLRQGHDKLSSLNHFQDIKQAFTEEEVHEIKKRLAGWHTVERRM